jgi:zinc ribbon protein
MSAVTCGSCGAEIADGTSFCRQCGEHVPPMSSASTLEATTRALDAPADGRPSTLPLNPKTTSPRYDSQLISQPSLTAKGLGATIRKRPLLTGGLIILAMALISAVILTSFRDRNSASVRTSLIYPGAETVLDITSGDGSVLQLRSDDPLEKVVGWYVANLKPTKNAKLSETSVLLKSDRITIGIAAENNKTNILIKRQIAP